MTTANARSEYRAQASATTTFGRVIVSARDQHWVADGPVQNGCPGEAPMPGELFLSGIAACAVELMEVLARDQGVALDSVTASISGTIDRENPKHDHVTVFDSVNLGLRLGGVSSEEAGQLVKAFKAR